MLVESNKYIIWDTIKRADDEKYRINTHINCAEVPSVGVTSKIQFENPVGFRIFPDMAFVCSSAVL